MTVRESDKSPVTATNPAQDIYCQVEALLLLADPDEKPKQVQDLNDLWCRLDVIEKARWLQPDTSPSIVRELQSPGRPAKPRLVEARQVPKRNIGTSSGRLALLHSLAHIEFNAINLALDAVYRFRDMPAAYVDDWLRVAADEGVHFQLLQARLRRLDSQYGELPAHDGLWDMARRTDHDVLVRMALVPRILEARGLDVAPPMIQKLLKLGDTASAEILERIYTDEITHVEIGNRWFRYLCEQRHLDGTEVFRDLLRGPNSAYLRRPFNQQARMLAGFSAAEMAVIEEMETEYRTREK